MSGGGKQGRVAGPWGLGTSRPKVGTPDDDRLAVTLTVGELRQLVMTAVLDAAANGALRGPVLLDREGLARALGMSAGTIDKLRKQGCPELRVGDSPRFELEACLEWLRRCQPR